MSKNIGTEFQEKLFGLRDLSEEENEKIISRMDYNYEAAKLRTLLADESSEKFHSPVEFSWKEFWKSFVYENLPPVFLSPIAAILMEGSFSRAWNVIQNRDLFAISSKHNPLSRIFISWIIIYPCSWLITIALLLALFSDIQFILNIDKFQIILAYICLFVRRLIISVKYGFYRPIELIRLGLPAPNWDSDKTYRKFIGQGWTTPHKFPGLIEDEINYAMDENDIFLQGIHIKLDKDSAYQLSKKTDSSLFLPKTSITKENEITSGFLIFSIISSVYKKNFTRPYQFFIYPLILAVPLTPFFVRSNFGTPLFGQNIYEYIISISIILGFLICFQLFYFGLICAIDFDRRYHSMKKLGSLIKFPGLSFYSFFNEKEYNNDKNNSSIFIDLQRRENIFGWMSIRRVLRSFGETYLLRIETYTSILIFFSLFCVGILNLIVWAEMRHHISTVFLITIIILSIAGISLHAIYKAIKLQSLSAEHRDFIRNELFIIEEEICELKSSKVSSRRLENLEGVKAMLNQIDETINFRELVYKPTTILGYAANNSVISSVLGLVLTGCLFAVQGFVSTGINYDNFGWFNF